MEPSDAVRALYKEIVKKREKKKPKLWKWLLVRASGRFGN